MISELSFPVMTSLKEIMSIYDDVSFIQEIIKKNGDGFDYLDSKFELSSIVCSNRLEHCLHILSNKIDYKEFCDKLAIIFDDETLYLSDNKKQSRAFDVMFEESKLDIVFEWCSALRDVSLVAANKCFDDSWNEEDEIRDRRWGEGWDKAYYIFREYQSRVLINALKTGEIEKNDK